MKRGLEPSRERTAVRCQHAHHKPGLFRRRGGAGEAPAFIRGLKARDLDPCPTRKGPVSGHFMSSVKDSARSLYQSSK